MHYVGHYFSDTIILLTIYSRKKSWKADDLTKRAAFGLICLSSERMQ